MKGNKQHHVSLASGGGNTNLTARPPTKGVSEAEVSGVEAVNRHSGGVSKAVGAWVF